MGKILLDARPQQPDLIGSEQLPQHHGTVGLERLGIRS
jgi:hypothetical protein